MDPTPAAAAILARLVPARTAPPPTRCGPRRCGLAEENLWLTRTAILHQLTYKQDTDTERLFRYCLARAGHRDFFIRKAIGWALRQYAWTDPAAVRRFVAVHAAELSPLSVREASRNLNRPGVLR